MHISRLGLVVVGLFIALVPSTAWAGPLIQETSSGEAKVWPSLLALLAAAFIVERFVEILWNYLGWILINFGGWPAERLKSSGVVQFKSGTSLLIAAVLGILIANMTSMRLFTQLQPLAPALLSGISDSWDVLVTGLLIGASTKPIHDIVGLIYHFKNYLANNAVKQRELASAALADGVLKLAQSEAESMIDVPGVGPTRLGFDNEEAENQDDTSPTDTYIDTLHNRTSV